MTDIERNCRILDYWSQIEALTAPDAEVHDEKGRDFVVSYVRDETFPWQEKLLARRHKHFVRFGIIARKAYDTELSRALDSVKPREHQDSGRYADHKKFTFLGVFAVEENGLPQAGTLDVAAFAPAFSTLIHNRHIAFKDCRQGMIEAFDESCEDYREEKKTVDAAFIRAVSSSALSRLEWTPEGMETAPLVIVRTAAIKNEKDYDIEPTINPINGFYFDDVCRVRDKHRAKEPTGLVERYLAEPDFSARIDCTSLDHVERILAIDQMPDGRWPSEHALTLMQQVAVNQAFANRRKEGSVFSVNGPPGAGKTTLLMDVVAALIVERAKLLCTFGDPGQAFKKKDQVTYPDVNNPIPLYALNEKLHGFSMVVASSNNGAVENITRELPNIKKLDEIYRGEDYFSELATALINNAKSEDEGDDERPEPIGAWGLVSAPLGNKENRNTFINTLNKYETIKTASGELKRERARYNIFRLLEEARAKTNWTEVCQGFAKALKNVHDLKAEIKSYTRLGAVIAELEQRIAAGAVDLKAGEEALQRLNNNQPLLALEVEKRQRQIRDADSGLSNLRFSRPGFFARLFHTNAFRMWTGQWNAALKRHHDLQQALRDSDTSLQDCNRNASAYLEHVTRTKAELVTHGEKADKARQALAEAHATGFIDFNQLRQMDADLREQALPLSNTKLHKARAELFLRALDVHKAFATSESFVKNLRRALDMLDGKKELRPKLPDIAVHLWETLFILVPVISTTFASMARCFGQVEGGQLGWLFIDEAGQAVPQHALAGLYRAKRAVIVGDPLQVPPVITFDEVADTKLLEQSGVEQRYKSTGTSSQILADNVNPFGSYLRGDWVGCPLRVHRRCVEPMFSISNAIAYEGKMVLGKGKKEEEERLTKGDAEKQVKARPLLGESRWFDVTGTAGQSGNYFPEQGKLALDLVGQFMSNGWIDEHRYKGLPLLFVISPCRTAVISLCTAKRRNRDRNSRELDNLRKSSYPVTTRRCLKTSY